MNRVMRGIALSAVALSLTACAKAQPPVAKPDGRYYPVTVSFGVDPNILLMGTCPAGADNKRDCRVEMLDLTTKRSVAFTAPEGRFLQMPSFAADGRTILAAATAVSFDETGNRPATIVRFDPKSPERAEVVVDSQTELLMPSETKWGFAAWTKKCETATQRYCAMDPLIRLPGQATPQRLTRSYGFRGIGPIFVKGSDIIAEAEFPADLDLDKLDLVDLEQRNTLWKLTSTTPNGLSKVPQLGLSGSAISGRNDENIYIVAEDKGGLGIFVGADRVFNRVARYPDHAMDGSLLSFAAMQDGREFAMVTLYPSHIADETKLIVADHLFRWRPIKLPYPDAVYAIKLASTGD